MPKAAREEAERYAVARIMEMGGYLVSGELPEVVPNRVTGTRVLK